jgi:hypothetical protein
MQRRASARPWLAAGVSLALGLAVGCAFSRDIDGVRPGDVARADVVRPDAGGEPDAGDRDAARDLADTATRDAGPTPDGPAWDVTIVPGVCGPTPTDPRQAVLPAADFADPVAVLATADRVFVANAHRGPDGTPGQGFVTVVDRTSRRVVNRIPTSLPHPSALALHGSTLLVVLQGVIRDDGGVTTPASDGGLDILDDVATADGAAGFDRTLVIAAAGLVGAPHAIALRPARGGLGDRAFVGSATTGAVFSIDLDACALAADVANPIVIENTTTPAHLSLATDADGLLWVAERVRSVVHAYDPETDTTAASVTGSPFELGRWAAAAPSAIVVRETSPRILVLLAETRRLAAIDPDTGALTLEYAALGAGPRALARTDDVLWVADAGEDALGRLDLADGGAQNPAFALFGPGAAPVAVSVTGEAGAREAWVALEGRDAVGVVDLDRGWVAAVVGGAPLPASCAAPVPAALPEAPFASPETAIVAGGYVVVASTNVALDGTPGQGFVTVIDPDSLAIVNRIPTTQPDPRALASDGRWLFVVNAGRTVLDAASGLRVPDPAADGAGGVDWIDLDTIATAAGPAANVPIGPGVGGPPAGAPGPIHLLADGRAWLGSTVGPYLLELDTGTCALVRGSDAPLVVDAGTARNDVATPFAGPDGLLAVALAATGRVHLVDPTDGRVDPGTPASPWDLGAASGPADGLRRAGAAPDLYVLLADAAAVATIDSASGAVDADWVTLAPAPTRLRAWGDRLYVANATADVVQRVAIAGADVGTFLTLPAGAGPSDLAIVALPRGETRAFVVGLLSGAVSVFDLGDGRLLGTVE